jgi:hypothetical protein
MGGPAARRPSGCAIVAKAWKSKALVGLHLESSAAVVDEVAPSSISVAWVVVVVVSGDVVASSGLVNYALASVAEFGVKTFEVEVFYSFEVAEVVVVALVVVTYSVVCFERMTTCDRGLVQWTV